MFKDKHDYNMCGSMFKNAVHLKTHNEISHKSKHSLKILKCNQCDLKFKLPVDLRNHMKDVHQPKGLKSILKNS